MRWFPRRPTGVRAALGSRCPESGSSGATRPRAARRDRLLHHRARRARAARFRPRGALEPGGGLWVAWPKKSSGVETDMTEDVVREVALPTGLVDNKVCAIDETWSGLRLVCRLEAERR